MTTNLDPKGVMEAYLEAALTGDHARCLAIASQALSDGMPIKQLYLDVFQAAQRRVGELWATNALTVGTEHRATGITQAVIATLYEHIMPSDSHGTPVLLACTDPERHEVGPRMVADFAEMAGYDVTYLGKANTADTLIEAIRIHRPVALGLSATLPSHLPVLARSITALRKAYPEDCPWIFVGGRAFSFDPGAWKRSGADCYAVDAEEAVGCLDQQARRHAR